MEDNRISRVGQIKIYFGKCIRLFVNEQQWKNLISTFIIMILVCMVTSSEMFVSFDATRKGCFAIVCTCILVGLFNSIQSICKERGIIKREHRTGLHISSYLIAHTIYEALLCLAQAFIILLLMLIRNIQHLPPSGIIFPMLIDVFITLFLITFSSDMIALMISCIVKKENTAMTVMPFVLIIQLIMSGMIFELEGLPKFISLFTISRWGLDALTAIANTDDALRLYSLFMDLKDSSPEVGNMLLLWLKLLLFAVIYIVIAIIMLRMVDKDKR